jgi:hypothetical protein
MLDQDPAAGGRGAKDLATAHGAAPRDRGHRHPRMVEMLPMQEAVADLEQFLRVGQPC